MKISFSISATVIVFACFAVEGALAGTGQIFSPAGLPQSSTQTYTPPTPGNTPTVGFPTPPLPVGGLSGFPASSLPLDNSGSQQKPGSAAVSGDSTAQLSAPLAPPINSIETFFQSQNTAARPDNKANSGGAGRLLWHVLDNLGVPMCLGKNEDLDPSLNRAFVMPTQPPPEKATVPVAPQKIPESELEGTEPSPGDAK